MVEVCLDIDGWLLLIEHLGLVKMVGFVHLPQIKLEFVIVHDRDVGSDEGALFIIKSLAKGGEVLVAIPLCVVRVLQGHQRSFRSSRI